MARIPLFFQQTFATQLYGALHDPDAEAVATRAKQKFDLGSILGPQSLGGFGASPADGFSVGRISGPQGSYDGSPEGTPNISKDEPANVGLGSSDRAPTKPKTYKVSGNKK